MTPRPRIAWLDAAAPLAENLAVLRTTPFSRYPVYRENEDEVLGVLEVKRLLRGGSLEMRLPEVFKRLAKPLFVPGTARALDLLEEFRDAQTQIALVVDEYGDRKSTRLNSSHPSISYAVFCLKKKNTKV